MLSLKETPPSERPREMLSNRGASYLSDASLIAILLSTGVKGKDALSIAREIVPIIDARGSELRLEDLVECSGIGRAKATLIIAALEFARRRIRPHGFKIRGATDVLPLLRHYIDRPQEYFICVSLNGAHEVIATRVVTIGLLNSTQVHPREVFTDPLKDRAAAIIVAHNHPSGHLTPSAEDKRVTETLAASGQILGIRLLDHIIFSPAGHFSFADAGLLRASLPE